MPTIAVAGSPTYHAGVMYTVVSGSKPGRPWLAIALTAGLMAGSTLLAWWLVRARSQPADGPLTERFAPESWPIALRLPAGWVRRDDLSSSDPPMITFADAPAGKARRLLHLIRHQWSTYIPPDTFARYAAVPSIGLLAEAATVPPSAVQRAPFGTLPGTVFTIHTRGGREYACATGSSPNGQTFAFLLRSGWARAGRDRAFVERLAEAVEITDPILRDKPDFTGKAIQFDPPASARFHEEKVEGLERIGCLSLETDSHPWYVVVSHTWLAEGRTPEQLLRARLAASAPTDDVRIETVPGEPDRAYRAVQGHDDPRSTQVEEFWCVPLGPGAAALIDGVASPDGAEALARVCRDLAKTVRPGPAASEVDAAAATARGKAVLDGIRRRGVGAWWSDAPVENWYIISRIGVPVGFHGSRRKPDTRKGQTGYRFRDTQLFRPALPARVVYTSHWFLEAHLAADFGEQARETRHRGGAVRYVGRESHRAGQTKRERRRNLAGRVIDDSIQIGDTSVGTPALELAQYLVASTPDDGPAIFTVATLFDPPGEVSTVWCKPLGRIAWQDPDGTVEVWGLRVRHDFDATYETLYFGNDGRLVREVTESGITFTITTREVIARLFGDLSQIAKDAERLLKSGE